MSITSLLQKGREERGVLERFADGCNAMARHIYLNRRVELIRVEGHFEPNMRMREKECHAGGYIGAAEDASDGDPLFAIMCLAHIIAVIPIMLATGVGLVAKKIVLATDKKSKKYDRLVKKYMDFLSKKEEAAKVQFLVVEGVNREKKLVEIISALKNGSSGQPTQAVEAGLERTSRCLQQDRIKLNSINKNLVEMSFELLTLKLQNFE